jgi:hypothetical protein
MGLNGALHAARDAGTLAGIVDLVPTFRSLTVHYDPLAVDGELSAHTLLQMAEGGRQHDQRRSPLAVAGVLATPNWHPTWNAWPRPKAWHRKASLRSAHRRHLSAFT